MACLHKYLAYQLNSLHLPPLSESLPEAYASWLRSHLKLFPRPAHHILCVDPIKPFACHVIEIATLDDLEMVVRVLAKSGHRHLGL
ncbi:MAG: hypothetical protein Q7K57_03145 [Burkholderiaceae bacterium]|nr:hypothetical protein [Burkholderiaceae bacterium]